jgi:chorismate mutase
MRDKPDHRIERRCRFRVQGMYGCSHDMDFSGVSRRLRQVRHREFHMTDTQLQQYRESIDNIDAALVFILAERFKVTQAVGHYKAQAGLPPADPGREAAQVARLRKLAEDARLDPDFTEKFLRFIIDEVIRHHEGMRGLGGR